MQNTFMEPLNYLKFLRTIADEIADTIVDANQKQKAKKHVVYYADLFGNYYCRREFDEQTNAQKQGLWVQSADRYVLWHGWSNETDTDDIQAEIETAIDYEYGIIAESISKEEDIDKWNFYQHRI